MKAYSASFRKKNGEIRKMLFADVNELPDTFLNEKIIGSGSEKNYPDGMQLVWDLEADSFRVFNWNTIEGEVRELEFNESHFD
jgi:hypothetical protein